MAHNINYNHQTGKHSFFSVREKAWHGLGQIVQDYPTSREALKFAGLDYTVEKRPLFTFDSANQNGDTDLIIPEVSVPDYYATVRTDTDQVLGVVGKDYQVVQNVQAFEFFDSIVGGSGGILYETAGALGQGERIFITAKLPDFIRVGRNDLIEKYLFLTTSHDGFGSITAAFTPVRIVCNNTLNAAMRNHANCIRMKHTSNVQDRLKVAHQLLGISNLLANELEAVFNHWSKLRTSDEQTRRLIELAMSPNKETYEAVKSGRYEDVSSLYMGTVNSAMEYAMASPTQQEETTKGTLFGAYNAITGFYQNFKSYKSEESRFKSIMYGTGQQRSQKAFDLCAGFAEFGKEILN